VQDVGHFMQAIDTGQDREPDAFPYPAAIVEELSGIGSELGVGPFPGATT
jgi:hypothetical protein